MTTRKAFLTSLLNSLRELYCSLYQWLVESLYYWAQLHFIHTQPWEMNTIAKLKDEKKGRQKAEGETQADAQKIVWRETERALERKWLDSHPNGSLPSAPQRWCSGEGETGGLEMEGWCSFMVLNHHHLCTWVDSRSRHQGAVPWCSLGQIEFLLHLQRGKRGWKRL